MNKTKRNRRLFITLSVIIIIVAPLIGALINYKGDLASHFFTFPPTAATPKPGFNLTVFIVLFFACAFFVVLYLYPWIFGFKKPEQRETPKITKVKYPIWFWIGLTVAIIDAVILWGHFSRPRFIINLGFIPIIWGLVFTIDGIVYKRSGGHSIVKDRPINLLWIGICSAFGWGYFEYLSLYVGVNWYYPEAHMLSTFEFYIYAFVGGAALVPFVFEIFMLLYTFKKLNRRYSYGPKVSLSKSVQIILLIIGIISLFLISFFPFILYPLLWIGPVLILSIIFDMVGLWTPFRPIVKEGNWTPLALIGLGNFISGLICEGTNFLSANHNPFHTFVPGYWKYSIPYVDKFHVFEMPLEGLFGYLPYGIYNWIVWIAFAYFFKITTQFDDEELIKKAY